MSYASRASQYLEADVMSRSPEWLVPLLYQNLVTRLRRADVQIEARDLAGKADSLCGATDIVMELAGSLDREKGGEIARNLSALYAFFAGEILAVGRSLDRARLARLTAMIAELHQAWVQAAEQVAPRGSALETAAA